MGRTAENGHLYVHEHEVELWGAEAQATGKGGGCQLTPLEEERNTLLACSGPGPGPGPASASASGCTLRLRLGLRLRRKGSGFHGLGFVGPRAVLGSDHHASLALVLQRELREGPNELLVVDRQHTAQARRRRHLLRRR